MKKFYLYVLSLDFSIFQNLCVVASLASLRLLSFHKILKNKEKRRGARDTMTQRFIMQLFQSKFSKVEATGSGVKLL